MPAPSAISTQPSRRSCKQRAGALLVSSDPFFNSRREQIVALAARHAIPTIYEWREFAAGRRPDELRDQAHRSLSPASASMPDAFSRAKSPPTCRSCSSTKFELIINLKTAKALGLTVPPALLARADEVIE